MRSLNKETGSAAHIAIIVVLVIAVIGLLGFVFWQNFMSPSKKTSVETASNTPTEQAGASIVIPEWNLQAPYDKETLGVLSYKISGDTLTFSSSKVDTEVLPCMGLRSNSWGVTRGQAGDTDTFGNDVAESWVKIGNAYYNRVYPQSGCEEKADLVGPIDSGYRSIFNSLAEL